MNATLEEDMYMVVHEDPGIDRTFTFYYVLSETFEKSRLVLIVVEYVGLVDSPQHDMVQGSGYVQSRLAWHEMIVLKRGSFVKLIAIRISTLYVPKVPSSCFKPESSEFGFIIILINLDSR
mgnify:CR=1 FL=1